MPLWQRGLPHPCSLFIIQGPLILLPLQTLQTNLVACLPRLVKMLPPCEVVLGRLTDLRMCFFVPVGLFPKGVVAGYDLC